MRCWRASGANGLPFSIPSGLSIAMKKAIALCHRIVVDHLRQQLPVREPLGFVRVDVFARDAKDSVGLGIGTLAIRIDARLPIISAAPATSPLITMPRMKRLASIVLKGVMKYPFVGSSR